MTSETVLRVGLDASGAKKGADDFVHSTTEIEKGAKKATDTVAITDKTVSVLGASLVKLGGVVAGYATFSKITENVISFDRALAKLSARTGLERTSEEFKSIVDAANQMGTTTEYNATKAIEGLDALKRAGFSTRDAIANIGSIAAFDEQNGKGLAGTGKQVADTLRAFGEGADKTAHLVDLLTVASGKANDEGSNLADALENVAFSAAGAGLSLDDTVALISQVASKGKGAVDVAGQLDVVLKRVAKGSGVAGVVDELKSIDEGSFKDPLFGKQLIASIAKIEDFKKSLGSIDGAAAKFDDTMDNTLGGTLERFESIIQTISTTKIVEGSVLDYLKKIIDGAGDAAKLIAGFPEAKEKLRTAFIDIPNAVAGGPDAVAALRDKLNNPATAVGGGGAISPEDAAYNESLKNRPIGAAPKTPNADKLREELDLRVQMLGKTEEEAKIASQVAKFHDAISKDLGQNTEEINKQTTAYEKQLRAVSDQEKTLAAIHERAKAAGDAVAQPIGDALNGVFKTLLEGGKLDLKALGATLGEQIAAGLVNALVVSPIVSTIQGVVQGAVEGALKAAATQAAAKETAVLLANLGNPQAANGLAISNGEVVPFAAGGHVTTGPEYFALNGGRVGVRGEAGPEGILPLARDAHGRLGVRTEGNSGGGLTINQYISTPDASSFRKQRAHMIADEEKARRRYG